jgi:hypothetical protein
MPAESALGYAERLRQGLDPTASGPPAARARKPSSIHLRRGVRVMAAMSCGYHPREVTVPLPVLCFIYTVPYIWRFAHEDAQHSAHVQVLAHP